LYCHLRGWEAAAALNLSAAVLIKLTPLILILYFLLFTPRPWRFLCYFLSWTVMFIALSSLFIGAHYWIYFIVSLGTSPPFHTFYSLWGWLHGVQKVTAISDQVQILISTIMTLLVVIYTLMSIRKVAPDDRPYYAFSILILVGLVISPLTWLHHHFNALLAYYFFLTILWRNRQILAFKIYIFMLFILFIFIPQTWMRSAKALFLPMGILRGILIIAILWLSVRSIRQSAPETSLAPAMEL
jgi:hypothetical protein